MALSNATIKYLVDWNNDLAFDDADGDISQYAKRALIRRSKSDNLRAGTLQLTLDNSDDYFTPTNTDSPFYGNLIIGRRIRVQATTAVTWDYITAHWEEIELQWQDITWNWEGGTATINLFTGYLDGITPEDSAKDSHNRECTFMVYDLLRLFDLRKYTSRTFTDYLTGEWINLLLNSFSWDGVATLDVSYLDENALLGPLEDSRDIDDGKTTIPYWHIDEKSLVIALRELVLSEGGIFYIDGNGYPVFEDRHHRPGDRDPLIEFTDTEISELTLEVVSPENNIEVTSYPRRVGTPASIIWRGVTDNTPQKLAKGETADFYINATDPDTGKSCEFYDMVTPAQGTDYIANSAEDGGGNDLSSKVTVTVTEQDNRYKLVVSHTHTDNLYITTLQVRATPLISDDKVTLTAMDNESIGTYLQRDYVLNLNLLSDVLQAQARADYELTIRKDQRTNVRRLKLAGGNIFTKCILDISDRITINSTRKKINEDYFIDGITHTINGENAANGVFEDIDTTWEVSPAPWSFVTLDVDTLDDDSVGLGY